MDAAGQNAASPANEVLTGCQFNTTPTTITSGNMSPLQCTAAGNQKIDLTTIAGTAPTTVGKIDVKGADGDVFVRQTTAANLNATVVDASLDNATLVDNAGFTDGTTRVQISGFIYDEVAGTALTENDAAAARVDSKRAQVMVVEDATTRGQRQSVEGARSSPSVADNAAAVAISPNNTGLPVNVPAVVQQAGNVTASGTTVTASLTPTQGNSFVVMCGVNNTGTITVSDNNSNTYTTAKSQTGITAGALVSFAVNVNAGATTFTCTAGTTGVVTITDKLTLELIVTNASADQDFSFEKVNFNFTNDASAMQVSIFRP